MEPPVKSGDLVQMSEFLRHILDSSGSIGSLQYKRFWFGFDAEMSATYLSVLLAKVISIDTGADRATSIVDVVKRLTSGDLPFEGSSSKLSASMDESSFVRQSLLLTIYFSILFYRCTGDHVHLKTIQQKWIPFMNEKTRLEFNDAMMKMMNPSYLDSNDAIIGFVDQCSNIEFSNTFDCSPEKFSAKQLAPSLINFYLRNCLLKGDHKAKLILETILLFLKHPLISEKRVLTLLYMLKQYFIQCPKVFPDLLNNAISIVKTYYFWPRPYGDMARDILQFLTIERKAPGAALRKRLSEENPELLKGSPKSGKERVVFLLVDQSFALARSMQEVIKADTLFDTSISQLQLNILSNIILNNSEAPEDSEGFEFLSREDVSRLYDICVQLLNQAILMKQEDAEAFLYKELSSVREEVFSIIDSSDKVPTGFQKVKPLSFLPLIFQFIAFQSDNSVSSGTLDTSSKYFRRSSIDIIMNIVGQYAAFSDPKSKPTIRIGIIGGDVSFHNILNSYVYLKATTPKSFEGLDLQFYLVPVESPCLFTSFLAKYDCWFGRQVVLSPQCILRILPCASSIGNPLIGGANDSNSNVNDGSIRSKTVSTSFENKAIDESVGKFGTNSTERTNAKTFREASLNSRFSESMLTFFELSPNDRTLANNPSTVLRSEMESFFREATYRLEINIYQCECWTIPEDGNVATTSSYFIPWFQRAELGIRAYARFVQKQNDLPDTLTLSQIQQHKLFKYNALVASLKYTQMNPLGIPKQGVTIEAKAYHLITIANTPLCTDRIPPNPTKPWLEMFTVECDMKKRKSKPTEKELEMSPLGTYHCSVVDIENEDKKKGGLHILLDGVVYGPFIRVRISACNNSGGVGVTGDFVKFPVMTFFPLDML